MDTAVPYSSQTTAAAGDSGSDALIEQTSRQQETFIEKKIERLLLSCISSSAICLISLIMTFVEITGLLAIAHPLFWLPITFGSLGVAGSNYIYLRRLWVTKTF